MAHVEKYTRSATGHLTAHYERRRDPDGRPIRYANIDVKPELSHLNYNLAPKREGGQIAFIRSRTEELDCQKRADIVVMADWIVTLPVGFEPVKDFFKATYAFLADRYGERNVISAHVHMDESQPHIHFAWVPVATDKKTGREKVCAKEVITRVELKKFHPELKAALEAALKVEVPVINGATAGGSRTVAELKAERDAAAAMARDEVAAVPAKRTIGGNVKLHPDDFRQLSNTAMTAERLYGERQSDRAAVESARDRERLADSALAGARSEVKAARAQLAKTRDLLGRLAEALPEEQKKAALEIAAGKDPWARERSERVRAGKGR